MKNLKDIVVTSLIFSLFFFITFNVICCGSFVIYSFSLLIGILFYLTLIITALALFNNYYVALVSLFVVNILLALINRFKILLLKDVVTIKDLLLIRNLWHIDLQQIYEMINLKLYLVVIIVSVVFWIFLKIFAKDKYRSSILVRTRLLLISFAVLIFLILIVKVMVLSTLIPDLRFRPDNNLKHNGYPVVLLQDLRSTKIPRPKRYSSKKIQHIAGNFSTEISKKQPGPNIIVVLSESFIDPEVIGIKYDEDVIANFKKIREQGIKGSLTVPVFGGLTANTEFELLTGFSLKLWPAAVIPYQDLLHLDYPTYINYFKQLGYQTIALHNYFGWFWNREMVYRQYGFDEYISIEDIAAENKTIKSLSVYPLDSYLFDEIIARLESEQSKPQLLFAITVQNHGLYGLKWPEDKLQIVSPESLSEATKQELLDFGNRLKLSDQDLIRLIDYLRDYPRETILVYFGDHLPPLYNYYEESNQSAMLDSEDYGYITPYFIWNNKRNLTQQKDLKIQYLFPYILDYFDLPMRGYEQFMIKHLCSPELADDYNYLVYDQLFGNKFSAEMFLLPDCFRK